MQQAPHHRRFARAIVAALLALPACVEDVTWIDVVSVVLDNPANVAVFQGEQVVEGRRGGWEIDGWWTEVGGEELARVTGSGDFEVEIVTSTPGQRSDVLVVAWVDDPGSGVMDGPDCEEDGTRVWIDLAVAEALRFPSEQYPFSWCGALLGPPE